MIVAIDSCFAFFGARQYGVTTRDQALMENIRADIFHNDLLHYDNDNDNDYDDDDDDDDDDGDDDDDDDTGNDNDNDKK